MTKTLKELAAIILNECTGERPEIAYEMALDLIHNLMNHIEQLEAQKDGAYSERNNLVATLSKLFPSWLEWHSEEDTSWDNDWRNIVFIDLPTGQVSWHIHDSEINNFQHLTKKVGSSWDGHNTEEKYRRLSLLIPLPEAEGLL